MSERLDNVRASLPGHSIEARFHLSSVKIQKAWDAEKSLISVVEFSAAKSGVFGKATPNGSMQMTIGNPAATEIFKNDFDKSIKENNRVPVYRIFMVLEEPGEEE